MSAPVEQHATADQPEAQVGDNETVKSQMSASVEQNDMAVQPEAQGGDNHAATMQSIAAGSVPVEQHDTFDQSEAQAGDNDAATMHSTAAESLETDPDTISDSDSALGSWRSARTQSLTSSVADYKYENGRRYHAFREGEYHMPNDDNEQDRLDLQHAIFRYALDNKLFRAPIPDDDLHDVLDVGCGTGLWAIDVADEHPQAQVLGFDLSPIQPDMVPPNCKFLVDDCNAEWLFAERFDLIHTRAMTPGVKGWPRYLQQAFDHLRPGGYIELQEVFMPPNCTAASTSAAEPKLDFIAWGEYAAVAGAKSGFDLALPKKIEGLLQAAGFVDIDIHWQNWPVGPWAKGAKNKHLGRWFAEDIKNGARNSAAMFTRVLGWKQEEFDVFAAKIAREIDEGKKHMFVEVCFAYARKPGGA